MGLPGLETLLPIVYTHGVLEGRLTPAEFVAKCCTNPARLMGLYPRKGTDRRAATPTSRSSTPTRRIEVDCANDGDERRLEPVPGLVARGLCRDDVLPRPKIVDRLQIRRRERLGPLAAARASGLARRPADDGAAVRAPRGETDHSGAIQACRPESR